MATSTKPAMRAVAPAMPDAVLDDDGPVRGSRNVGGAVAGGVGGLVGGVVGGLVGGVVGGVVTHHTADALRSSASVGKVTMRPARRCRSRSR